MCSHLAAHIICDFLLRCLVAIHFIYDILFRSKTNLLAKCVREFRIDTGLKREFEMLSMPFRITLIAAEWILGTTGITAQKKWCLLHAARRGLPLAAIPRLLLTLNQGAPVMSPTR